MFVNALLLSGVFLPGMVALGIYLFLKKKTISFKNFLVIVATLIPFITALLIYSTVANQNIITAHYDVLLPVGVAFHIDELSLFMSMGISILWIFATIFSFN